MADPFALYAPPPDQDVILSPGAQDLASAFGIGQPPRERLYVSPERPGPERPKGPHEVDWSRYNQPVGELRQSQYTPTERLGNAASDALQAGGMQPYTANDLVHRFGDVLGMTPLGVAGSAIDTVDANRRGDMGGTIEGMAGMIPAAGPEARAGVKAARKGAKAVTEAVQPALEAVEHDPFMPPTGSMNPLDNVPVTFSGKQPKDFTPQDWKAFGDHYGVENMGPLSDPVVYNDVNGQPFVVPGGTHGTWTYADLLHMKANPINPANVDRDLHADMQRKLGRTMTPPGLTDSDVWNGLVFGMTSPNNPLFPNQVTASRLRLRTPQMIDDLASMIPWKPGQEVPAAARQQVSDNIAQRFGLSAAAKGGLGVRGSADYSRVGEMAQMFKQNPDFFRKKPDEDWGQAVERISSQLPGLSMKTGSFGTVWQDPANAAISAIDRHMARELEKVGGIFESPEARTAWENRGVALWNKRNPGDQAAGWTDLMNKRGSDGFVGEMLLDHVGNAATPKFRMKSGNINPAIPAHLANANWVREPESVYKMGAAYKQALAVNQKLADEHGLNLFMSQWMEWDRIRNRFEPHENMFPGLSKVPALSLDQLREVDAAHRMTGHKTYTKTDEGTLPPTKPFKGNFSQLGYLGLAGLAGAPALLQGQREEGR